MELSFVPSVCKGNKAKYEGKVTIKSPSLSERLRFLDKCGVKLDENGELDFTTVTKDLGRIADMVEYSKDFVIAVDIKRKSDSKKYLSYDEISHENDLSLALIEIATQISSGGAKVGNA